MATGAPPFRRLPGSGLTDDELELGRVAGVFGVRGEVRLFLHHRESDLLSEPRQVVLVDPSGTRWSATLTVRPGAGKRILGRLDGVADRDVAASLRDWRVGIRRDALPTLDEGEFYDWQVIGADVRIDGESVGFVDAVHHTEGGEVFVVRHRGQPWFIPCVKEWILGIDLESSVVELAPGALDDEEEE